jgi:hypothetical protein
MALRMAMFYEPQTTQVNEEPALETSLDLKLMQHPHDEDLKRREVHARFEVEPLGAWYNHISPNSHTLVILLQVDFTFGDEPETIITNLPPLCMSVFTTP